MPKFRTITGQFVGYIPDSIDSDIVPDRAPMNGRVTFTPVFTGGVIAFPELVPPEFAHPRTIPAKIVDGSVRVEVNEGTGDDVEAVLQPLSLMVTVDDEASQVWSWRADFDEILIGASDEYVKIPAWSFRVPDGTGPVDLTELVPLKSGGSVDVTKGPRGAGLQNITAIDGQLVFEYTDGQETTVPVPEAVQGPQGEPGPAGADGAQGPEGPQGPAGEIPDLLVGNITDATPTGKNLMLAATEGAARNTLGLQSGATAANGSLAELNEGTGSTPRVWTASNISNFIGPKVEEAKMFVNVKDYGATGDGDTDDRDAFASAVAATTDGGTVFVPSGKYALSSFINTGKSLTIQGEPGATIKIGNSSGFLNFNNATGIRVKDLAIEGTLDPEIPASQTGQKAIIVTNSSDVEISGCTFANIEWAGVWLSNVDGWVVKDNRFNSYGYCATTSNTGSNGKFLNNDLTGTGKYPAGYSYCYGLALTHNEATDGPNTTVVSNNTVTNQAWEALDTHGGKNIVFNSNIIRNCEAGIVATPVVGVVNSTPESIIISNNVIDAGSYPRPRQGASIAGPEAAGSTQKATGSISGNTIIGYGMVSSDPRYAAYISSSIHVTRCDGVTINSNNIVNTYGCAIKVRLAVNVSIIGNVVRTIRDEVGVERTRRGITLVGDCEAIATNNIFYVSGSYLGAMSIDGTAYLDNSSNNEWGKFAVMLGLAQRGNTAPNAITGINDYPVGVSHFRVISGLGYPSNGVLRTSNLGRDRAIQELLTSNSDVGTDKRRVWSADTGSWSDWYSLPR